MTDDDKKAFKLLLDAMCNATNTPLFDKLTLRTWWDNLNTYALENLTLKIDAYITEHKKPPTLDNLKIKTERPVKEIKMEFNKYSGNRGKEWARKILDNPTAYPEISIRRAKEALGAE